MRFKIPACNRILPFIVIPLMCGCSSQPEHAGDNNSELTLGQARVGYTTRLTSQTKTPDAVETPPPDLFELVTYPDPLGNLPAYVSRAPETGKRFPAIIWLTGGFSNSIGDTAWAPATPDNDQSASAFRKAGVITMYPSLRGGNNNPGYIEGFYGEVTDVMAAANYLAKRPDVDPKRIYLGGHSTGGTLALLIAESSNQFRAIFSFGPVSDASNYGSDSVPFDVNDAKECELRAPIKWLHSIKNPTFVIEGTEEPGNISELRLLSNASQNPLIHFIEVPGQNHFSELAQTTPVVADAIIKDTALQVNINISSDQFGKM